MTDEREWMSPKELADWLNLPVQTVYRWRTKGSGPKGISIGRHVRYRRNEIERWLSEQEASGR